MKKNKIITTLQNIADSQEQSIEKYVAGLALDYSEDHPEDFIKNVLTYGCVTGIVRDLVYYTDTHTFFDTYYDEIEDLRMEYESSTGCSVNLKDVDLKNALAWFAVEQTAYNLSNKIGLDL